VKIAFVTLYDLNDIQRGSGTYYHMAKELENQCNTVYYLGPISIKLPLLTRVFRKISTSILGKRYSSFQDPFSAKRIGREIERMLGGLDCDILLTNDFCVAGYSSVKCPIVLFTDDMFPRDHTKSNDPRITSLSGISAWLSKITTKKGMESADTIIFPSQWIIDEAILGWEIQQEKIFNIPFGANINPPPKKEIIQRSISKMKVKGRFDLLFVGKDWERKGGEIAVSTVFYLQELGINAQLHVVGRENPNLHKSDYIVNHGLLDKSDERDYQKLIDLYKDCDAFILPSIAEGYVISVVEASAFGLPVLAFDSNGVREPINRGKTGILLPVGASGKEFANVIYSWFQNPESYEYLVTGARDHFDNYGSWEVNVKKLCELLESNRYC